jgi:electron transport complex protein RnfD
VVGLIRLFGGFAEGVMYSILFMNTFVPLLNRYLRPRILGERRGAS